MATSNGAFAANGVNGTHSGALNILIVGAGIGGLTAALALRQQGHQVTLFEQSRFANELGAAIHLAPNGNGILRRLGLFAEEFGANKMERLTEYSAEGKVTREIDLAEPNKMWQHPWLLAHRVHLHESLKRMATSNSGKGMPAKLNTSSKVVDVDCKNASVTLENGDSIHGDLVVGADGVHSKTRSKIPGGDVKPFSSGKSAFRFLIKRQKALENPKTKRFAEKNGELIIWYGRDRRLVMYPCQNNELLNFVCIHPESASEAGGDWNQEGSTSKLVEVFKEFGPDVSALLSLADASTLKVWNLLDMKVIPTWVNDRLALLGDAAHPFLPHQGQGGGCAIEDAASLAVMFPAGTLSREIPERLKLYETCRYERANKIQEFSRLIGRDLDEDPGMDMVQYTAYNFGHDEWDFSTQALRKWTWAKNPSLYWRMPIAFGPMPGPRQTFEGKPRKATESTFTTASIKFKTSRTLLQNLFPTPAFSFASPATVAQCSFSQTTLGKMEWLGHGGYKHIGLYIHGVKYTKKDGSTISGTYMPILFESLTDPIVSGREELGMPKLLTEIDIHHRKDSYRINTSWQGARWGRFSWEGLEDVDPKTESGTIGGEADDGIIVYRYIPSVGQRGKADAEYPVFVPHAAESKVVPSKVERVMKAKNAKIDIDEMDWDALPTLHHIVTRLGEIPIYEVVSAKVVEGLGVPDVSSAVRVE